MSLSVQRGAVPASTAAAASGWEPVLDCARDLRQRSASGASPPLLRGRNLGLTSEAGHDGEAALFLRAASELGAHVAMFRVTLTRSSDDADIVRIAHVLARLYDAVECQGLAPELVRRLGEAAGIPVFDALASASHPSSELVERLGGPVAEDDRRFVLQAVLVQALR
jgi:ornithine carbamoyltransferase